MNANQRKSVVIDFLNFTSWIQVKVTRHHV